MCLASARRIFFGAFVFLSGVMPALAHADVDVCVGGGGNIPISVGGFGGNIGIGGSFGSGCGFGGFGFLNQFGLPSGSILGIVGALVSWALALFGFIGIIGFIIAGVMYLTASGDETKAEKAKQAMLYSIIGIIVGLLGFVIIQAVNAWLNTSATF